MTRDRVLDLYTQAVEACRRRDAPRAHSALTELMDSLDLEFGAAAGGLFRLYDDALRHTRKARFEQALAILCGLREAYVAVSEPD
jgi:hypothetical protein